VRIVALVSDLMDRSRLSNAVPDAEFVTDAKAAAGADCVVIDLGRFAGTVSEIRHLAPGARLIAFGAHVDDDALVAAREAGADVVMPRSRFFRDPAAAIAPVAPDA
jgi:hypothetical protein